MTQKEDKFIVYLMEHPKATDEEISKKVGLSRSGVAKRRKSLEEKGEIEYFISPNLGKICRRLISGIVKFSPAISFKQVEAYAKKLATKENVISVWIRKGGRDIWGLDLMYLAPKDIGSELKFEEVWSELKKDLREEFGPDIKGWDVAGSTYVVKMFGRVLSNKDWD